ncbi:MAG: hypothetical protein ACFCUU_16745 [Cyclobacteriaceae bacterium]
MKNSHTQSIDSLKIELLKNSVSLKDFTDRIIDHFKKDSFVFNEYLFKLFYDNLQEIFEKEYGLAQIKPTDQIESLLPHGSRKKDLKKLEILSGLFMPKPVMSIVNFSLLIFLILVPILSIFLTAFYNPALFIALFEIILGGGFIIIFGLVILVHFLKPSLLASNDLPRVTFFSDFVNEVVRLNEHFYRINNFQLIIDELAIEYLNFSTLKKLN